MRKYFLYILSGLVAATFSGCESFDKPEEIPSYIYVTSWSLNTDPGNEGENTHKFVDAWVYMDNNLIGAFELPAYIPILAEGEHDFRIRPGIMNNGISDERKTYPFCTDDEITLTLIRDSVITINPETEYKSGANFIIEDFESASVIYSASASSDTVMTDEPGGPTGDFGKIVTTTSQDYVRVVTNGNYILPQSGNRVFLELDYYTNVELRVGVIAETGQGDNTHYNRTIITPTDNDGTSWNHIYIELTDQISSEFLTNQFEIFIEFNKLGAGYISETGLDNIKVVY